MKSWLAYAQLVRLPNAFTAMADICLAGAATGAILDYFGPFLCLLCASTLLYSAGMVWNDYFDLEQDLRERPFRPLASGRISKSAAFMLGCSLIVLGLGLVALADLISGRPLHSLPIAAWLVAAIFLYDGVLKRTWGGPYAMGACRFCNILLGLSAGGEIKPWGYALALSIGVYIVGVTWFAKTEARLSKQTTLLAAALVMAGGLFLALAVPALALEMPFDASSALPPVTPSAAFPYLLATFGFYVGLKVIPAVNDPKPTRVQPAVKRAVLGLVFLDAILATALVGLAGLAIILLLIPAYILGRWIYST